MYLKRRVHTVASAEAICHEDRRECGTVQVGMRWQAYGRRRAISANRGAWRAPYAGQRKHRRPCSSAGVFSHVTSTMQSQRPESKPMATVEELSSDYPCCVGGFPPFRASMTPPSQGDDDLASQTAELEKVNSIFMAAYYECSKDCGVIALASKSRQFTEKGKHAARHTLQNCHRWLKIQSPQASVLLPPNPTARST